jgi:DNA replicative helicase MCM subunit Mcm2 (Cdc46/Mcm family)
MQHVDFTASYSCAHCGESMVIEVDPSAGSEQEYVEDCQICCSPNVLTVNFLADGSAEVVSRAE